MSLRGRAALVISFFVLGAAVWPDLAAARRAGFASATRDGAAGRAAIDALRPVVLAEAQAEGLAESPARAALEDPLPPPSAPAELVRAGGLIASAREAFRRFEYDDALGDLRQAEVALRALAPTPEVVAALYDAQLLAGQVHAARKDEARAIDAFRLARRVAPERGELDPARYPPAIVALYGKAAALPAGKARLTVITEPPGARVWLDGKPVGAAPLELTDVAPGEHYLAATLDGHAARGERVRLADGDAASETLLLGRLPAEERARSLRAGLMAEGLADVTWARAAADLADLASVDLMIVVRDAPAGGGLEAAAWDVRAARLSKWHAIGGAAEDQAFAEKLRPAAADLRVPPPKDLPFSDGPGGPVDPGPKPRWYRTWWGTALIIGGAVVVGGVVIALSSPGGEELPPSLVIDDVGFSLGGGR